MVAIEKKWPIACSVVGMGPFHGASGHVCMPQSILPTHISKTVGVNFKTVGAGRMVDYSTNMVTIPVKHEMLLASKHFKTPALSMCQGKYSPSAMHWGRKKKIRVGIYNVRASVNDVVEWRQCVSLAFTKNMTCKIGPRALIRVRYSSNNVRILVLKARNMVKKSMLG